MNANKLFACGLLFLLLTQPGVYSQEEVSSQVAEDSAADKVGDWFATFGKSKEERMKILQERKTKRKALREERKMRMQEAETKEEREKIRQEYKEKDKAARGEYKSKRQEMKQELKEERMQTKEEIRQGEDEKPKWGPDRRSLKYQGKGKGGK